MFHTFPVDIWFSSTSRVVCVCACVCARVRAFVCVSKMSPHFSSQGDSRTLAWLWESSRGLQPGNWSTEAAASVQLQSLVRKTSTRVGSLLRTFQKATKTRVTSMIPAQKRVRGDKKPYASTPRNLKLSLCRVKERKRRRISAWVRLVAKRCSLGWLYSWKPTD